MTDEQIRSVIKKCRWNDNVINGYNRDESEVICRSYCLPCLKVIDDGKCDTLIELFKNGGKHGSKEKIL